MNRKNSLIPKEQPPPLKKGARVSTPLGEMFFISTREALSHAFFVDQASGDLSVVCEDTPQEPILQEATRQITQYFQGSRKKFTVPLSPQGSHFDKTIWKILENIPFGSYSTYGEVAHTLHLPKASRAVGAACGRNPIAIFIPCHRVIGKNHRLVGYAGGLERKNSLLHLEGAL